MKFKFCSEGDCPLWALAALHALSSLPSGLFKKLVACVADGQNDDNLMILLKDTSLSSRDESARAAAVIRWVFSQAISSDCTSNQLTRDLLVIGVPRSHATALSDALDDLDKSVFREESRGLKANTLRVGTVTEGPEGSVVGTCKLNLTTDSGRDEIILDKIQAKALLMELEKAQKIMQDMPYSE